MKTQLLGTAGIVLLGLALGLGCIDVGAIPPPQVSQGGAGASAPAGASGVGGGATAGAGGASGGATAGAGGVGGGTTAGAGGASGGATAGAGGVCVGAIAGAGDASGGPMTGAAGVGGPMANCSSTISAVAVGGDECAVMPGGRVACWGTTPSGLSALPVLVPDLTGVTALSGRSGDCALLSDGSVSCWSSIGPTPVSVPNLTGVKAIAVGEQFEACAIVSDGFIWCWSLDRDPLTAPTYFPALASVPAQFSGLMHAKALALGNDHACAVLSDGSAWCWGHVGSLGDGTPPMTVCDGTSCSSPPVRVSGLTDVTAIAAGGSSTCALVSNGSVWCWGDNSFGQLGRGTPGDYSSTPVQVSGLTDATSISVSPSSTSCAVRSGGAVSCWGSNHGGTLGIGVGNGPEECGGIPCSRSPMAVAHLSGATSVSAGDGVVCALTAGTVECWGANDYGQLGTGSLNGPEPCDTTGEGAGYCTTTPVAIACPGAPGAPANVAISELPVVSTVTTSAGAANPAGFAIPWGVAPDAAGNLYVGDSGNNLIFKVTPAGVVTTLVGSGDVPAFNDGTGNAASFNAPKGVAVDGSGNVYVADTLNHRIRQVTPAGVVTTLAGSGDPAFNDGTGTAASFNSPVGIAVDGSGNVYVGDSANNCIRKVTALGVVTTLAGSCSPQPPCAFADGAGTDARFCDPQGVAVDAGGNIYVSDSNNHLIRKVTPAGVVTTFAGSGKAGFADGIGGAASFNNPSGVAVDAAGNVYVSDSNNHLIRWITPAGVVTTLAGTGAVGGADGSGTTATFNTIFGVAVDTDGNVYVSDSAIGAIRKITSVGIGQLLVTWSRPSMEGASPITGYTASARAAGQTTLTCNTTGATSCTISGLTSGVTYSVSVIATNAAGTGMPSVPATGTPNDINGPGVAPTAPGAPSPPLSVLASVATVTTLAGSGAPLFADGMGSSASFKTPWGVAADAAGNLYVTDAGNHRIRKVTAAGDVTTLAGSGTSGSADGTGAAATFGRPEGIAVDTSGNLYVADAIYFRVRKVTPAGVVTTLAGSGMGRFADGKGAAASFYRPTGVAVDTGGNVYVADYNRIRKVTAAGVVTTLADQTGTALAFNGPTGPGPTGVAVDARGNVYVIDGGGIQRVTAAGVVTTLAGIGSDGVTVDAAGNVYVTGSGFLQRVTPAGLVTTLAGSSDRTSGDGLGAVAGFAAPTGVAVDAAGNVYVSDSSNNAIRKITPLGRGQVAVTWSAPTNRGFSPITEYLVSARAACQPTLTCSTTGSIACTISGPTGGVVYSVSVTATNANGTSAPSVPTNGTAF